MNVGEYCDNEAWVNMTDPRTYEYHKLLFGNNDEIENPIENLEENRLAYFKS
jgi:hypothetical protein